MNNLSKQCISIAVITYENESNIFRITKGVRQGRVLNPLLFISAMDRIIKVTKPRMKQLRI